MLRFNIESAQAKNKSGFTLIEMSIVIVIIGLIVGGVLVAQDLIKAAKWKKIHSQLQEYETAAMTFKLKYDKLPGDMNTASNFFGTYCQKSGYSNVFCNGNNNKVINNESRAESNPSYLVGYQFDSAAFAWESIIFWRHLFLAGLMKQETTGEGKWRFTVIAGENIPTTEFGMGIAILGKGFFVGKFPVNSGNPAIGQEPGRAGEAAVWSKMDQYLFDKKFDDGLPQTGKIKVIGTTVGGTYTSQCQNLASNIYSMSTTPPGCVIIYEWLK